MATIRTAMVWMKKGLKVSSDRYLEGDYFYYDDSKDAVMFNGPGREPEIAVFNPDMFEDESWFIFREKQTNIKTIPYHYPKPIKPRYPYWKEYKRTYNSSNLKNIDCNSSKF